MTTIATDGKTMSSDSLETANDTITGSSVQKMWKLSDGRIVGVAGDVAQIHRFLDWLDLDDEDRKPSRFKGMSALMLHPDGSVTMFEGDAGVFMPQEIPAAIGTGYISALTALDMGADTAKAIQMAIKRDVMSGGKVQTLRL